VRDDHGQKIPTLGSFGRIDPGKLLEHFHK
jgi:hypothetical protein